MAVGVKPPSQLSDDRLQAGGRVGEESRDHRRRVGSEQLWSTSRTPCRVASGSCSQVA